MGFFGRKSISLGKGIRLNIGKRGVTSVSVGRGLLGFNLPLGSSRSGSPTSGGKALGTGCVGCLGISVLGSLFLSVGSALIGNSFRDKQAELESQITYEPLPKQQLATIPPEPLKVATPPPAPPPKPATKPPIAESDVASLVAPISLVEPVLGEKARTWSDASKKFNTEAVLISANADSVTIQRTDNQKELTLPLSKLCEEDQIYSKQATAPRVNPKAKVIIGRIVDVLDSDTIRIANALESVKTVRLNGIDAPEKNQPLGKEALARLQALILNKQGRVEYTSSDKYQRILGEVYVDDIWVNAQIVATGDAWQYDKYSNDQGLAKLQYFAKFNKLGIWHDDQAVPPWDWRDGVRDVAVESGVNSEDTVTVYITKLGKHYHTDSCRHVRKEKIPIQLNKARSAYQPCKICEPTQ